MIEQAETLIEVRGIYDGWSIARMKDGSLVNRWPDDDPRHAPTQKVIEKMQEQANGNP